MKTRQENNSRRNFLKQVSAFGGLTALATGASASVLINTYNIDSEKSDGDVINIKSLPEAESYKPLQEIKIDCSESGTISVLDSQGNKYYETASEGKELSFLVGGAIGTQFIFLTNKKGQLADVASFIVDCKTEIEDEGGKYKELLKNLYFSMVSEWEREAQTLTYEGKYYNVFVCWLRDHVHTMKGMKYFYPKLKTGIELYSDTQREDGMIWDNYHAKEKGKSYWDQRFAYGDFYMAESSDKHEFRRIPVENDVEYLFIEGIYYTWKATGDDKWMASLLDKAIKAYNYSTSNEYRWSEKYQLLKRGFTIDTWDFQSNEDAKISAGEGRAPDGMVIRLGNTRFGVFYGDNTGFSVGCHYLSEMLAHVGRNAEAEKYTKLGNDIMDRLNKLSWNGEYYKQHIPEDTSIVRDHGVDLDKQVSLSNAYSLNRGITHEQAVAIIKTYQRLKNEMPKSSPGEWYTVYPPYEKGFGGHGEKWEYMNGGVTTIVAGELAHGAYEHGHEEYASDILNRILALSNESDGFLYCTHRGAAPERPEINYTPISLKEIANTDFVGTTKVKGVAPWTNEGENDLHEFPVGKQVFHDVPFDVIDPAKNGRKACVGLSGDEGGYTIKSSLKIEKKTQSIYILHTTSKSYYSGCVAIKYDDGTEHIDYIAPGKIANWWYPQDPKDSLQMPKMKIAWRGQNKKCESIGVTLYGINNPHPENTIKTIDFEGPRDKSKWMVLGITLSNKPVFFKSDMISFGIPDNWGAAAVVYALVEGLVGVKDTGVAYDKVLLSPKWSSTNVKSAKATIKYEASGGYVSYNYKQTGNDLDISFTSNSNNVDIEILLPKDKKASKLVLNNKEVDFNIKKVENSSYLVTSSKDKGVQNLKILISS